MSNIETNTKDTDSATEIEAVDPAEHCVRCGNLDSNCVEPIPLCSQCLLKYQGEVRRSVPDLSGHSFVYRIIWVVVIIVLLITNVLIFESIIQFFWRTQSVPVGLTLTQLVLVVVTYSIHRWFAKEFFNFRTLHRQLIQRLGLSDAVAKGDFSVHHALFFYERSIPGQMAMPANYGMLLIGRGMIFVTKELKCFTMPMSAIKSVRLSVHPSLLDLEDNENSAKPFVKVTLGENRFTPERPVFVSIRSYPRLSENLQANDLLVQHFERIKAEELTPVQ